METLEDKIARVVKEEVAVVPYDPRWPALFEQERIHLRSCLPGDVVKRIEHFGSTAVPGLAAKPIVDILVEVTSLDETKRKVVPILEAQKYDHFWRPTWGEDTPPFYAWFIKRDQAGKRTHHIHMVEADFEHWDRLLFRDYLRQFPDVARQYGELKWKLAGAHHGDRVSYTKAKTEFVVKITAQAKEYYGNNPLIRTGGGIPPPPLTSGVEFPKIIHIRLAKDGDAQGIAGVGWASFTSAFGHLFASEVLARYLEDTYTSGKIAKSLTKQGNLYFVAEIQNRMVGFLKLQKASPHPLIAGGHQIQLQKIYVMPESAGAGVGSALMKRSEETILAEGPACAWLMVYDGNTRALSFYRRFGYLPIGTDRHDFEDLRVNFVVLKKDFAMRSDREDAAFAE